MHSRYFSRILLKYDNDRDSLASRNQYRIQNDTTKHLEDFRLEEGLDEPEKVNKIQRKIIALLKVIKTPKLKTQTYNFDNDSLCEHKEVPKTTRNHNLINFHGCDSKNSLSNKPGNLSERYMIFQRFDF